MIRCVAGMVTWAAVALLSLSSPERGKQPLSCESVRGWSAWVAAQKVLTGVQEEGGDNQGQFVDYVLDGVKVARGVAWCNAANAYIYRSAVVRSGGDPWQAVAVKQGMVLDTWQNLVKYMPKHVYEFGSTTTMKDLLKIRRGVSLYFTRDSQDSSRAGHVGVVASVKPVFKDVPFLGQFMIQQLDAVEILTIEGNTTGPNGRDGVFSKLYRVAPDSNGKLIWRDHFGEELKRLHPLGVALPVWCSEPKANSTALRSKSGYDFNIDPVLEQLRDSALKMPAQK